MLTHFAERETESSKQLSGFPRAWAKASLPEAPGLSCPILCHPDSLSFTLSLERLSVSNGLGQIEEEQGCGFLEWLNHLNTMGLVPERRWTGDCSYMSGMVWELFLFTVFIHSQSATSALCTSQPGSISSTPVSSFSQWPLEQCFSASALWTFWVGWGVVLCIAGWLAAPLASAH